MTAIPVDDSPKSRNELGEKDPCMVTICLSGFGDRHDGANAWFGEICDSVWHTVYDCDQDECQPLFAHSDDEGALESLVESLDKDGDGRVTELDPQCTVAIAGYSWGGYNGVAKVAANFLTDDRVEPARRKVDRLIAVDPFKVVGLSVPDVLKVPKGVENFWSFRHSSSPKDDCSSGAIGGPYKGIRPICPQGTLCWDHDYSAEPERLYWGNIYGDTLGSEVGHCRILDVAYGAIRTRILHGADSPHDNAPLVGVETYL